MRADHVPGLVLRRGRVSAAAVGIGLVALALFLLIRLGLIELFTAWNRWQFAARPEVENWALPGYGVDLPATLWAFVIVAVGVAAAIVVATLGQRRS